MGIVVQGNFVRIFLGHSLRGGTVLLGISTVKGKKQILSLRAHSTQFSVSKQHFLLIITQNRMKLMVASQNPKTMHANMYANKNTLLVKFKTYKS